MNNFFAGWLSTFLPNESEAISRSDSITARRLKIIGALVFPVMKVSRRLIKNLFYNDGGKVRIVCGVQNFFKQSVAVRILLCMYEVKLWMAVNFL